MPALPLVQGDGKWRYQPLVRSEEYTETLWRRLNSFLSRSKQYVSTGYDPQEVLTGWRTVLSAIVVPARRWGIVVPVFSAATATILIGIRPPALAAATVAAAAIGFFLLCTPCGCNGGPCYLLDGRHGMTFGLDGDWSLKLISCGADGEKNDLGVCALCCSWGASPPRPLAAPSLCPLSDTDRAPLTTPPLLLACNKTSFSCKLQNFFIEWVMVCCWFVVHENVLQSCHGYPVIHGSWCLEFLRGMS